MNEDFEAKVESFRPEINNKDIYTFLLQA